MESDKVKIICDKLSNVEKNVSLTDKLKKIVNGKYRQYNYLKEITGSKSFTDKSFGCPKNCGLGMQCCNFMVPAVIDDSLKYEENPPEMVELVMEKPKTPLDPLINGDAKSCNELDFLDSLLKRGIISEDAKKEIMATIDVRNRINIPKLFSFISNALVNGKPGKGLLGSYKRKEYPLGLPSCSGCDNVIKNFLNCFYISVEQKTSGSGRAHIIQQVSNELECIEDAHAEIDVKIARNENVRKHIFDYGTAYIYSAPDTINEVEETFGDKGYLVLKLSELSEVGVKWLENILFRRAVYLGAKRLMLKPSWSTELERILPATRSQFKNPKWKNEYTAFTNVSTPISYNVENVSFISMITERYFEARSRAENPPQAAEINKWRKSVEEITANLRKEDFEETLNYSQTAFYIANAYLCSQLDFVREFADLARPRKRIPTEIGITNGFFGGLDRVLAIISNILVRNINMKNGIREIAGLFKCADVKQVSDLLKTIIIAIKTIKRLDTAKEKEFPITKAHISNGTLNMSPLYGEGQVAIDLESFKPEKAFR